MKLWKQWAALIIAVLMVFMAVACTPVEPTEPSESQPSDTIATTEATEAPTTEATDATEATIDLTPYKDYLGTWYADGSSAGYRFILAEDLTWQYANADEESVLGGSFALGENCLNMYDPEGSLSIVLTLEEAGKVYAEIYTDSLLDMLSTSYFFNTVTNNDSDFVPIGDDPSEIIVDPTENTTTEDTIPDVGPDETIPEVGSDETTD